MKSSYRRILQLLISKVYRKSTSSMKKNQLLCPIILIIIQNIMTREELNAEKKELTKNWQKSLQKRLQRCKAKGLQKK